MRNTFIIIIWAVIILAKCIYTWSDNPLRYMLDYCSMGNDTAIPVDTTLILRMSFPGNLVKHRVDSERVVCGLHVEPKDENKRLMLHIITLNVEQRAPNTDRVDIYNSTAPRTFKLMSSASGLHGTYADNDPSRQSRRVRDYTSDSFYIRYMGVPTREYRGFAILFTEMTKPGTDCTSSQTKCEGLGVCISKSLRCDRYPNCGRHDDSDETGCGFESEGGWEQNEESLVWIAGVVGAAVFLFIVIIICLVIRLKKNGDPNRIPIVSDYEDEQAAQAMLSSLQAPPSYQDVMSDTPPCGHSSASSSESSSSSSEEEPPPSYDTVAYIKPKPRRPRRPRRPGSQKARKSSMPTIVHVHSSGDMENGIQAADDNKNTHVKLTNIENVHLEHLGEVQEDNNDGGEPAPVIFTTSC